jgi:hypothetical protein
MSYHIVYICKDLKKTDDKSLRNGNPANGFGQSGFCPNKHLQIFYHLNEDAALL